jgi:tRNA threonylcarbamoyladenosine biosynthesis protein TsaB
MLLLAVDTSGKNGSLALARVEPGQGGREISVLEVVPLAGGAFSAQLVPKIAALLKRCGHNKSDLGGFAVVSGPGSFTGLRVGLAAIKALAEVLQQPIAAISLLEAVACSGATLSSTHERVLAALDAGRGDVYVGDYELDPAAGLRNRMHSERLLSREEFLAEASRTLSDFPQSKPKTVVTPDPILAESVRAVGMRADLIDYPSSAVIAQLGWDHLQHGETVRPEELEANYIRRSDAEIFSKPGL